MNKINSPIIPFNKEGENKKGFTLVELIVVITILAILATIWFVSFSGYLAGTRDTNRKAQIKSMSDALELYRTKKDLPIPDDKVDIKVWTWANERVIAYQWYIWKNVLETIEYTESWLDPKDKQYFSYYLTKNKKYFQLMAFLEEPNEDVVALNINKTNASLDYSEREAFVAGKKLWILVWGWENTPIQEIESITGSWYLNVETTTDTYKAVLENLNTNNWVIEWTGSTLKMLAWTAAVWWVKNSCKTILEKDSKLKWKDWYYLINQDSPTKVYCDMTTNWWWWTRYIDIKWNYLREDAKKCWLSKNSWTNWSWTIECFNPNRLNFVVSGFMLKVDYNSNSDIDNDEIWEKEFLNSYPSQIEKVHSTSNTFKCLWGQEYMTIAKSWWWDVWPKSDVSDASRIWLWLSYCEESKYEVWWIRLEDLANWKYYMNYSKTEFWKKSPWTFSDTVFKTQMFIR